MNIVIDTSPAANATVPPTGLDLAAPAGSRLGEFLAQAEPAAKFRPMPGAGPCAGTYTLRVLVDGQPASLSWMRTQKGREFIRLAVPLCFHG